MVNWACTTSKARGKHREGLTAQAKDLCAELGIPVIARQNRGIPWLMEQYALECLLVEEDGGLLAHWGDGSRFSFHPGMAVHRIKQIKDGKQEMLTQILEIEPGDEILDCTLGMANDAIVLSFAAGAQGHVTALESSPLIYAITSYGLCHWSTNSARMKAAMERIETIHCAYEDYLRQCVPDQFDTVYFDPMFEQPVYTSSGIAPLRRAANYAPLTEETLERACQVARRKVAVRHRAGTLTHLHFDEIKGGKYSTLAYGVRYANGK